MVFFYFYIKLNDYIENEYPRDVEVELMARINGKIYYKCLYTIL